MDEKDLTPEQDEAVRRLLAVARHDEPMPPEVATRLEDVLADLTAERDAEPAAPEPSSRKTSPDPFRQRRWPKVLVAAAAVSVIGLGLSQVPGGNAGDDSGGDSGTAAGPHAAQEETTSDGDVEAEAPEVIDGASAGPGTKANGNRSDRGAPLLVELERQYLRLDADTRSAFGAVSNHLDRSDRGPLQPLNRSHLASAVRELGQSLDDQSLYRMQRKAAFDGFTYDAGIAPQDCGPVYTVVGGRATYATYRSRLALVVFHPEINDTQLVELYVCGGKTPRRSVERVTLWDGE